MEASRTRLTPLLAAIAVSLLVLGALFGPARGQAGGAAAPTQGRLGELIALDLKFDGANSCSAAQCHGAAQPKEPPAQAGNEYLIWSEKDPHARSYDSLIRPNVQKNAAFGQIAQKLGIANAAQSERCLNCHALDVPDNRRGDKFNIREGNTCTNCHGPSQKWMQPHAEVGWAEKQRQTMSHADLLKNWGLFDTKPPIARAEICVSCHLAIDPELVAAGHPQPIFELDFYSAFENFSTDDFEKARHWRDPLDQQPYYNVKLWAAGQAVSLREAMTQLAQRAKGTADEAAIKDAYEQAMGHYAMFKVLAKQLNIDIGAWEPAANSLKQAIGNIGAQKAAIADAATTLSQGAAQQLAAVEKFQPDQNAALAMLNAIAADQSIAKDYGLHGVEQQVLAIYGLYNNYATVAAPAEAEAVFDALVALFAPLQEKKVDVEQYTKDLAAAQAKLPKG